MTAIAACFIFPVTLFFPFDNEKKPKIRGKFIREQRAKVAKIYFSSISRFGDIIVTQKENFFSCDYGDIKTGR